MAWKQSVSKGIKKVGEEAGKAYDKGKNKAEQLQTEMKMDGLAKKLGYLTLDAHRGRKVDEAARTKLLDELTELEKALETAKAEAEAKAAADKRAKAEAETKAAAEKAPKDAK